MELLPDAKPHFAADDEDDHWIEREQDWAREWVGVGIVKGDFMVCYEWNGYIENGILNEEIGIRKAPGTSTSIDNFYRLIGKKVDSEELNKWWYVCDNQKNNIDCLERERIVNKMSDYLKQLPKL